MSRLRDMIQHKVQEKVHEKHPTIKADYTAYTSGSNKTFSSAYNNYVTSIETIERAIRVIANVVSLAKMGVYKEDTSGELKPLKVKNVDLMFPNEVDSYIDFQRKLAVQIFVQGAAVVVAESNKGMTNFYVLDAAKITIESDGKNLIDRFKYTAESGEEIFYKAKDVIYINDSINPANLLYSLTRLQALNDVVQMQAGIVNRTKEYAQGAAKESAIVSTDTPLGKDTQLKIKDAFDTFMRSTTSSTLFLNTKVDVKQLSTAMSVSEMLEFFTRINKIMLDQFNLPPALLGDYSASGANKNEELLYSLRVWFATNLLPVMKNIELHFTKYFRNVLGLKNAVLKFNYNDIDILEDFIDTKVDRAIRLSKAGLISINEARLLAEYKELDYEAARYHFLPAYLLGSAPVSVENFDAEVERLLQGVSNDSTLPAGNSGDEDNENIITGSRGGAQDEA